MQALSCCAGEQAALIRVFAGNAETGGARSGDWPAAPPCIRYVSCKTCCSCMSSAGMTAVDHCPGDRLQQIRVPSLTICNKRTPCCRPTGKRVPATGRQRRAISAGCVGRHGRTIAAQSRDLQLCCWQLAGTHSRQLRWAAHCHSQHCKQVTDFPGGCRLAIRDGALRRCIRALWFGASCNPNLLDTIRRKGAFRCSEPELQWSKLSAGSVLI
jgi:hypothetical protein